MQPRERRNALLNAAGEAGYDRLCRPLLPGAYRAALAFAEECIGRGMATSLSVVDHPDVDVPACAALAARMGAAFRVRALVLPPIGDEGERA